MTDVLGDAVELLRAAACNAEVGLEEDAIKWAERAVHILRAMQMSAINERLRRQGDAGLSYSISTVASA